MDALCDSRMCCGPVLASGKPCELSLHMEETNKKIDIMENQITNIKKINKEIDTFLKPFIESNKIEIIKKLTDKYIDNLILTETCNNYEKLFFDDQKNNLFVFEQ